MPLSEEESDFLRLLILVVKVAPLAVRHLFNQKFPPSNLGADLQSNRAMLNNLKTKRIINSAQWDLLFPPSVSVTCSTTFDVTLLICLLRNIKPAGSSTSAIPPPLTGFDKLPLSTDHSSGADLARIKHFRNFLAHHKEAKIAKAEFNSAWTDLCEGIKRIGGGNYNQECTDLRVTSLDESQKEVYKEILRTQAELESMKTEFHGEVSKTQSEIESVKRKAESELASVKKKTRSELASVKKKTRSELASVKKKTRSELASVKKKLAAVKSAQEEKEESIPKHLKEEQESSIPKHMNEKFQIRIRSWKEDEETFSVTRATESVAKLIETNNVVTVVGSSGSGKSSIIHHVALQLESVQKFELIPFVSSPVDIIQYRDMKKNQLFIIDDLCGKNYMNENDVESWKKHIKDIIELFPDPSSDQGKSKILVSCRLQISKNEQFKQLDLFSKTAVDLQSEKYCLLPVERSTMIGKYTKNKIPENRWQEINKNLGDCHFFPLLCKLAKGRNIHQLQDLFSSPIHSIRKDIKDMILKNPMEKCALVLCVLFPDGFHEDFIDPETRPQTVQQKVTDIIKNFKEVTLGSEREIEKFRKTFKQLDGTYVKKLGPMYTISHDKMYDMVAVEGSHQMTKLFLKYAPSTLVAEQYRFKSIFKVDDNDILIYLNENYQNLYFDRIVQDLKQAKSYQPFFHNQQLKEEKYRIKVMEYIQQNKESCDKLFRRLDREGMTEERKYWFKIWYRDDTYTYFTTPVIEATKTGFYDLVQYFIQINCDCNKKDSDDDGRSPLWYSCENGFINVTDLLMRQGVEYDDELVMACMNGEIDVVRVMFDYGVDLSVCGLFGETPLTAACREGQSDVVKLLLDKGADPLQTDLMGDTALDAAREWEREKWGNDTIINLLKSHMKQ